MKQVAPWMFTVLLALNSPALAQGPADALKIATIQILDALQAPTPHKPEQLDELRNQIRTVVNEIFEWREMCRRVLSPYWELLTEQERDDFTALFEDVVQRSYLSQVTDLQGEAIAMGPLEETIDGTHAIVRTQLMSKSHVLPIAYRLIEDERGWKVYDIAIEGISVLSSSHSQIGRLVQHFGYSGMMTALKMKQSRLMIEENQRRLTIGGRVDPSR